MDKIVDKEESKLSILNLYKQSKNNMWMPFFPKIPVFQNIYGYGYLGNCFPSSSFTHKGDLATMSAGASSSLI